MTTTTIQQAIELAIRHHQSGRLQEAEVIYRQILAEQPNHPDALHLLGVIAGQGGRTDEAVVLIRRAIAAAPGNPGYHCNLGVFLQGQGQLDQAIASYQKALEIKPDYHQAFLKLGNARMDKRELDQAIFCYQRVLEIKPDHAEAYNNLGNAWKEKGQLDQAIACCRRAVALNPDYAEAHYNLGNAKLAKGRLDEAIDCYQRALKLRPDYVEAHSNLGAAWVNKGQLDEAIASYERAVRIKPDYAGAYYNLGNVWKNKGQLDQAIACFQRALALKGDDPQAYNNLGNVWQEKGQLDQAAACYQRALQIKPDYYQTHMNLGNVWKDKGQIERAIACYERSMALSPNNAIVHSNLIYAVHFLERCDQAGLLKEHRRWARQHAHPLRHLIHPHDNDRDPDRPLRIGYVSPDFGNHPIGRFMLPLLAAHDHKAFQIFCYAEVSSPDDVTAKLQPHADAWRNILGLTDEEVAALIRRDKIDILVDLTMHMSGNRLLVFARKPAPVQVTYLAYCGTTGLETVDYRLTDPYLDPPGGDEQYYTERSIRLAQSYWCYQPPIDGLELSPSPALAAGRITFGCLNNFCKINPSTIRTWCDLLKAVPNSRLLLHAGHGDHRQRMGELLAEKGIDSQRLEFVDKLSLPKYMRQYNEIDIALDPFPYVGGTTSCDALWMGVPVITLRGPTAISRGGVSILSNIGLPESIAETSGQYVKIAADLANDLPRLSELRSTLRQRMKQSPLMDAPGFARDMESAYRQMWRQWCSRQTAESSTSSMTIQRTFDSAVGHFQAGRHQEVESLCRQILAIEPNHSDALHLLGVSAGQVGRHDLATDLIRQAIAVSPGNADYHGNLGMFLQKQGKLDQAVVCFQRALEIKPDSPETYNNLGITWKAMGQLDRAIACYQRALALKPDYPSTHNNLGNVWKEMGQVERAIACYERALALSPTDAALHSNLVYVMHFLECRDRMALLGEQRRWARQQADPLRHLIRPHGNDRNPNRRLRIGYVSPNFWEHCQALFTGPLFSRHDHRDFEIFCYGDSAMRDDYTARIRGWADGWRDIVGMNDRQAAQFIRGDQIDILVDLTLHMTQNRMPLFALKPAPVQATWLGYPGTTGLETMDYRLTDPYLDPPGQTDQFYSERSIRLPHTFWCYAPGMLDGEDFPEVNPLPALKEGAVTFGCLNNFCKVNQPLLDLWARVLAAVPGSRLLLLAPEGSSRQWVLDRLGGAGISAQRVEFLARQSRRKYMQTHHRIDIGLDTWPCNGHTTSLDSFWMGVPVITLVGQTAMGRAGLSQLTNLGLSELIAHAPDEFVRLAADLAGDLPRLSALRSTLRQRMQNSPLMDAGGFARGVEEAYRQMWRNWCEKR